VGLGALLQASIVLWRPAGRVFGVRPFTAAQWMVVTVASAVGALLVAALPSFSGRRRTVKAGPP
jgi:hypothetical protein